MADLLESLISPEPPEASLHHPNNSSQESFHSAEEEGEGGKSDTLEGLKGTHHHHHHLTKQSDDQPPVSQASASSSSSTFSNPADLAFAPPSPPRKQTKSGQVYDVDAFLADPANLALLGNAVTTTTSTVSQTNKSVQNGGRSQEAAAAPPQQPIELGTQTSHFVSRLNHECQIRGLVPIFEIDDGDREAEAETGRAAFRGVLRIEDQTVRLDEPCGIKKKARERLAELGLQLVEGMDVKKRENPVGSHDTGSSIQKEPNWVGMLQEYFNLEHNGSAQPPVYTFYSLGSHYACTVTSPTINPDQQFGSPTISFPSKKQAQRHAAAAAVQFLVSEGRLASDGSTLARKAPKSVSSNGGGSGSSVRFRTPAGHEDGTAIEVVKEATYAQRINDIAPMLGLSTPVYQLHPESINAPNILSGYVSFPNSSRDLPARVGEVRHCFGKKAAKEQVAKGAWEILVKLAEKRGVQLAG